MPLLPANFACHQGRRHQPISSQSQPQDTQSFLSTLLQEVKETEVEGLQVHQQGLECQHCWHVGSVGEQTVPQFANAKRQFALDLGQCTRENKCKQMRSHPTGGIRQCLKSGRLPPDIPSTTNRDRYVSGNEHLALQEGKRDVQFQQHNCAGRLWERLCMKYSSCLWPPAQYRQSIWGIGVHSRGESSNGRNRGVRFRWRSSGVSCRGR
mmetsp:Transcript_24510/g.38802  ORF Transcript_24510/g.38802 Transcript_24510/m.38802 type:complete len:209 (-) Transcript_24510:874-1500(-)